MKTRALLNALTDTCEKFCLNLARSRLTQEDHVEIALVFLDLADRMLKGLIDTPTVTGNNTT